jgi:hypothetical protein
MKGEANIRSCGETEEEQDEGSSLDRGTYGFDKAEHD